MTQEEPKLEVQGIRVDLPSLLGIRHYCDPALCREGPCCCHEYEVAFPSRELSRIVGLARDASRYAPEVAPGGELENPFEPDGSGQYLLDTNENGVCAFAFQDKVGCTWCSLHSVALDHNLPAERHKPSPCSLWPLALTEDEPPVLTVQDDIQRFPCVWKRNARKTLYPDIADCIRRVFGETFLQEVQAHLQGASVRM